MSRRMQTWTKWDRLAPLMQERGLSKKGFRKSMKKLVREFAVDLSDYERDPKTGSYIIRPELADDDYRWTLEEWVATETEEWFGCYGWPVPAAYRIVRHEPCEKIWDVTVEVYEVEGASDVPEWKYGWYGDVADAEGPDINLHILDKYDNEIVIESEDLMPFMLFGIAEKLDIGLRQNLRTLRAQGKVHHHTVKVPDPEALEAQQHTIRELRRRLSKSQRPKIEAALKEIVYGLGTQQPRRTIARRVNLDTDVVKAVENLLKSKNIDPKAAVKSTHARWKAAYDALSELGIFQ